MDEFDRLPHWSRVAFAAKCARRVQTILTSAWPDASPSLLGDVERAIALAEQSVAEGQARDGLKEAASAALRAAGRALIPHHYPVQLPADDDDEEKDPDTPTPEDSLIASFTAKAAEYAARAALAESSNSAQPAWRAVQFAYDSIEAAGRPELAEELNADLQVLIASTPRRPWWRFW